MSRGKGALFSIYAPLSSCVRREVHVPLLIRYPTPYFALYCNPYADSTSSSSFFTCVSSKRCMSFAEEVVVSDVLSTCILSLSVCHRSTDVYIYHRGVKFIDVLPLLLPRLHYVDLLIVEVALFASVLYCCFGRVAERTRAPREEGDATLQQPRRSSKHLRKRESADDDAPSQSRVHTVDEGELPHRLASSSFSADARTYDIALLDDFQNIPSKLRRNTQLTRLRFSAACYSLLVLCLSTQHCSQNQSATMAKKCVHKGCGKTYDNESEECLYHPGPPVFHEGQKGKQLQFLSVPPGNQPWSFQACNTDTKLSYQAGNAANPASSPLTNSSPSHPAQRAPTPT